MHHVWLIFSAIHWILATYGYDALNFLATCDGMNFNLVYNTWLKLSTCPFVLSCKNKLQITSNACQLSSHFLCEAPINIFLHFHVLEWKNGHRNSLHILCQQTIFYQSFWERSTRVQWMQFTIFNRSYYRSKNFCVCLKSQSRTIYSETSEVMT